MIARFVLSKQKVFGQFEKLKELGVGVSYSYKTNREGGDVLQGVDCDFSVHLFDEIDMIKDKEKSWFFSQ